MRVFLDDGVLRDRAMMRLGRAHGLAPNVEPRFDPRLPLPLPPLPADGFPTFGELFGRIPEPYAVQIFHAYAQMSGFAGTAWPAMCGLIDAEPFFEWMMQTDLFKPWYRDHIVHQVRVAAIGDLLLDQRVGGRTLLRRAVAGLRERISQVTVHLEEFVRLAWWTAALFHDGMYPYQNHHEQCGRLQGACGLPLANPTHTSWFEAHKALAGLIGGLTRDDLSRCETAHHQFGSAAELALQNERYEESIRARNGGGERDEFRARRRLLFTLACEAILSHHKLRRPPDKISFGQCPLGFLLVLSDELHEADRPGARTFARPVPPETVLRLNNGEIEAVDVRSGPNGLRIEFRCREVTDEIRGDPNEIWREEKQRRLDEMLTTDLFGPFQVRLRVP